MNKNILCEIKDHTSDPVTGLCLQCCDENLALSQDDYKTYCTQGNQLIYCERYFSIYLSDLFEQAIDCYNHASQINQSFYEILNSKGDALYQELQQ